MKNALSKKLNNIINFLFPLKHTCNVCGREIFSGEYFCDDCIKDLPVNDKVICSHCGRRVFNNEEYCNSCNGRETYFDRARSAYVYAHPIDKLIGGLKYHGKRYLANVLIERVVAVYYQNLFAADFVIYTPMSEERRRERGYNQAELLARAFCEKTKLELRGDIVIKTKETLRQAVTQSAKERKSNLQGSFSVVNKKEVEGKNIILIDDVMTTGATVELICEKLKRAKANKIFVLVVASVSKGEEGKLR